ncbi:unnamed protein product [Psylliodes chrysocephalus]|uniref:Uncharacterized protein n=1 Tax=Psylliodes chrysocephalus TaxID=3402493 RepID=A0A9P0CLV2_9CUCU|nr:unnamed protein product [Psylliodes chrysocephala]
MKIKYILKQSVGAITISECDYRELNVTTQNAFNYVCVYLIKKLLHIHSCEICVNFSEECNLLNNSNLLTHFKAYNAEEKIFGNLKSPSEKFLFYIFKLEKIFISLFDSLSTKPGISNAYLFEMSKIEFGHSCQQFAKMYTIKLFIIFYTLKYANRDLKSSKKSNKTKRKIKILSHL